jgi:hypothetical protein
MMYQAANALLKLRNSEQRERADRLEALWEQAGILHPNQPLLMPVSVFYFMMEMAIWEDL